jgi:hypothetical protein
MTNHWFWYLMMLASLIWYSTITIYIAIKGATDIKVMLGALGKINDENELVRQAEAREPVGARTEK